MNSSNSITNTLLIDSTREVNDISGLSRKIDSITKTLSRPYFNKILKDLLEVNPHNANIVIDYLITEQTELNIKDSTKEGKIKVLVELARFVGLRISIRLLMKTYSLILIDIENLRK